YVTLTYAIYKSIAHFRNLLPFFSLKSIFHQPFPYKFFTQLLLSLPVFLVSLVGICIKIAGGIGSMHLIHQVNGVTYFSKLVFSIHQDQVLFCSQFFSPLKECQSIAFQLLIIFFSHKALPDDFFPR